MTQEQWGELKKELLKSVGSNSYKNWIEPLEFDGVTDGIATFSVPTSFLGNYVSRNFGELILYQMTARSPEVKRLNFQVAANTTTRPTTAAQPVTKAAQNPVDGFLPAAPLDDRFTFDTFVVGKPNELAHAAAKRVAEGGPVTFNPLFLYGGVGLGKTHLMHAIAWELQARRPDLNVVYLSAEQFMYRFVQALRDRKMMDFKQMFRSVDVLMVDDVQFIAGKDSARKKNSSIRSTRWSIRTSRSSFPATAPRGRSRTSKTGSSRACNVAWWWTCTRPITSCASAFCSPRRNSSVRSIPTCTWTKACSNSSPTASAPMSACSKGR